MAQIIKKFIGNDQVGAAKVRLENDAWLRGRNQADDADVNLVKVATDNTVESANVFKDPTQDQQIATKKYVDDQVGSPVVHEKETFTLDSDDITNEYVDLGFEAKEDSINVKVRGAGEILEGTGEDYTVDYTGGAGGVTRVTFVNTLQTLLEIGDVVQISYTR